MYQPEASSVQEETVLRVPSSWLFPTSGFTVTVTPSGVARWEVGCCGLLDNSTVTVALTDSWAGEEIVVVIAAG